MTHQEPAISLAIFGTRISNMGFVRQLYLNTPPFENLEDKGVARLGNNRFYYTIRIEGEYTQYTLVYNPKIIKANRASREGALKVSISIPKGYRLAGGASPSNVLWDIHKVLEDLAFEPRLREGAPYEFKEKFPGEEEFMKVLNYYKLERVEMPHRTMSSTSDVVAILRVEENNLDSFFADVQYPEFQGFKEIAVAESCQTSDELKDLEIPRKPKYSVKVNGIDKTLEPGYKFVYNYHFKVDTLNLFGRDERAYEGQLVDFTVQEVLEGTEKHPEWFKLDKANETITVTLPAPNEKRVDYQIIVEGCHESFVTVNYDGKEKTISPSHMITLIGVENINPATHIAVTVNSVSNYLLNDATINESAKKIIVKVKEKPKTIINWDGSEKMKTKIMRITLEDSKDIIDISQSFQVEVSIHNYPFRLAYKCHFNQTGKGNGYTAEIEFPDGIKGSCRLFLRTDTVEIPGGKPFKADANEVKVSKNETDKLQKTQEKSNSLKKMMPILGWLLAILFAAGLLWSHFNESEVVVGENDTVPQDTAANAGAKGNEMAETIKLFLERLQDEEITFKEIKDMDSWITRNLSALPKTNDVKDLKKKVAAYTEVIKCFENPSKRDYYEIKQVASKNKEKLASVHFEIIKRIWDKGTKEISGAEGRKVNNRMRSDDVYKSFLDLPSSKEILSGAVEDTNRGGGGGHNGDPNQESIWKE